MNQKNRFYNSFPIDNCKKKKKIVIYDKKQYEENI